ncbi:MAG: hypothetical protein JWR85_3948 [Marmoricola sp.]|nr:hypothetical protein [Marmoricola sp.]
MKGIMTSYNKIIRDIYISPRRLASKVQFKQYLTNRSEPAEAIADVIPPNANQQSNVIENTYQRKQIFRKIAAKLRFRAKT